MAQHDEWRPPAEPANELERRKLEPLPDWAHQLVRWLDTAVRIPGTDITIGLDAVLGLFLPTAGDALTGIGALSLFTLAVRHNVPKVVLAKMLINVAVDSLFGSIPIVGDVFDVLWRSNKKNLELIERYRAEPGKPATVGDHVVVGLAFLVLLTLLALPIVVAVLVIGGLWRWATGG
jgi:hypothetical protein